MAPSSWPQVGESRTRKRSWRTGNSARGRLSVAAGTRGMDHRKRWSAPRRGQNVHTSGTGGWACLFLCDRPPGLSTSKLNPRLAHARAAGIYLTGCLSQTSGTAGPCSRRTPRRSNRRPAQMHLQGRGVRGNPGAESSVVAGPVRDPKIPRASGVLELNLHLLRSVRVFQFTSYAYFGLVAAGDIEVAGPHVNRQCAPRLEGHVEAALGSGALRLGETKNREQHAAKRQYRLGRFLRTCSTITIMMMGIAGGPHGTA